jgi:Holliday junction resolvase RusA-like endonuclease
MTDLPVHAERQGNQSLTCNVIGLPVSQGSLVARGFGPGLRYQNDASLKLWRHMVISEVRAARPEGWNQRAAVSCTMTFRFPRNKGHFNRHGALLPSAPAYKATKPDLDKCTRAVFDSIEQAGLILNDSQIISVNASKRWALADEGPGVLLTIISTQECDVEEPEKT